MIRVEQSTCDTEKAAIRTNLSLNDSRLVKCLPELRVLAAFHAGRSQRPVIISADNS